MTIMVLKTSQPQNETGFCNQAEKQDNDGSHWRRTSVTKYRYP